MTLREERRKKRSSDPLVALHYQLSTARTDADLDAVVLADTSGVVVAGAGSWATCEELAAYAPLLAAGEILEVARIDAMRSEIEVQRVTGHDVLLCTRGKNPNGRRSESIARAAEGVSRILRAA
jgi:hypothetical protein